MVNMGVIYQRPNRALSTYTAELRAKYGDPARTYEYVTGYKSPSNISGHNADNNGVVHSVDVFVGPGNLTEAQGIAEAELLRVEGTKGTIPGHPDRLAYIIHRQRIAGDHTDWKWINYTGPDGHYDHIHVSSVFDYYWGDPVAGDPLDYDSTAPWNLGATTKPQGGTVTPIPPAPVVQKDWFDMATAKDLETAVEKVLTSPAVLDKIALAILKRPCYLIDPTGKTGNRVTQSTTLATKINWMAHNDAQELSFLVAIATKLGIAVDLIQDLPEALRRQEDDGDGAIEVATSGGAQ